MQNNAFPSNNQYPNYYGNINQNQVYSPQPIIQTHQIVQPEPSNIYYGTQPITQQLYGAQPQGQQEPSNIYYDAQPITHGAQPQGQQITVTINYGNSQNEQNDKNKINEINSQRIYPQSNADQPKQEDNYQEEVKPLNYQPRSNWKRSITRGPVSLQDPSKSGSGNLFFCVLFMIGILACLIGLLSFHFGHKELKLTSMSGALEYISQNLNSNPILDISLVNRGLSCPAGYQKVNIGTWPGTDDGCKCSNRSVKKYLCNRDEIGCFSVHSINAIGLADWQQSDWCVKRAIPETEFVKQSTCPSGFTECSPGICIENSLSCPITSLSLTNNPAGNSGQIADSGDGRYLVASRVLGNNPLINVAISINDIPCFSNNAVAKGPTDPYILLKFKPKGCERYGTDDQFSFFLDSQTQAKVMTDNQVDLRVWNLPDYIPIMQSTLAYLSGRNRITVSNNDDCLSLDTTTIQEASLAADKMNNAVSITSIVGIVFHGILIVLVLFVLLALKKTNSWSEVLKGKESGGWLLLFAVFGTIQTINYIVMFAIVREQRLALLLAEEYIVSLDKKGCFLVGQPKTVVEDYPILIDEVVTKLYQYSQALLCLSLITIVPTLCIIYHRSNKHNKI